MADPTSIVTAFKDHEQDVDRADDIIKTSEALVNWALGMIDVSSGKVEFADDADNLAPVGQIVGPSDGDSTHLTGNGTYKVTTRGEIILSNVSVTGASSAADVLKPVFATDGQTLTLTPPTTGIPVGYVHKWNSSTYCDVFLFSKKHAALLAYMQGIPYRYKEFGIFPTNALQGTAAVTLFQETSLEHYAFQSLHAACAAHDDAVVAGDQDLNLNIGGTDTTGGVLTLGFGDCDAAGDMGAVINATAITAANEVHMGDVVKLEMAASGTGFTPDSAAAFRIYAKIKMLPGA